MKRIFKGIFSLALVCLFASGLLGCKDSVVNAYDIAVKNGFVGTEEEWLRSLHGENGKDGEDITAQSLYDAAVANGYEGSFLDFCKTLDVSMPTYNDTATISKNLTSVVSIYCGYSVTTTSGGWFGTSNSVSYGYQMGSGVIVDLNKEAGNAYILTNYHVVYNLECDQEGILNSIWVYPYGAYNAFTPKTGDVRGDGIKATYVGGSMDYDIAVLKVEGNERLQKSAATEAELGDSEKLRVGEETFVIGNPAGQGLAVTNGILSVPSEYISIYALDNRDEDGDRKVDTVSYRVLRTSAAINGGNSGGGIFNAAGELIGIVNAKNAQTTTDNMGYALPINQVRKVYENILANGGKVKQAYLGVMVSVQASKCVLDSDGNAQIVEEFVVSTAAEKGTASYQKLSAGDIFLAASINGGEKITFTREYQLTEVLLSVRLGDTVDFTVCNSNGQEEVVSISFNKAEYFRTFL